MSADRRRFRRVLEWEIDSALAQQAQNLLQECFPGYPSRSYFKLPPQERYFVYQADDLVAHAGIEHRVIRVGDVVVKAIGVVDVCVSEGHRSSGIATSLLEEITEYARECAVDFVILFADRHDLYLQAGWELVRNPVQRVKIDEHRILGIAPPPALGDCMMVKPVGSIGWPSGDVDMLGHVF